MVYIQIDSFIEMFYVQKPNIKSQVSSLGAEDPAGILKFNYEIPEIIAEIYSPKQSKHSALMDYNSIAAHKRKIRDVTKLLLSDFKVSQEDDETFVTEFFGPDDSLYETGKW
jgi:hypothetical protein